MRYGLEALVQFLILAPASWLVFVRYFQEYFPDGLLNILLPYSFLFLTWLIIIALIAGGWPLTLPLGMIRQGMSRPLVGLSMTSIWLALSGVSAIAFGEILGTRQAMVLGIISLWIALVWGINFGSWPLRQYRPSVAFVIGAAVPFALGAIFSFLSAGVNISYLEGVMIHNAAWSLVISQPFVLQGYSIRRFHRQPRIGVAALLIALALTALSWELLTVRLGFLSTGTSEVLAAGVAMWSLTYSWVFGFLGISKYKQPTRGFLSLPIVAGLSVVWTFVMLLVSPPAIALYATLAVIPSALLVHNIFWLRVPLSPPLLPGMPPTYQQGVEVLRRWYSQVID